MFLETNKKEECFGCTACLQICPTQAINMKEDEEGFLYPTIDESKCIHCNRCRKICPYQEKIEETKAEIYGVKLKDIEERKKSQSGGAFFAIATYILKNSGVIYGVATGDNLEVEHIRISTERELNRIRGSKYVQSNVQGIYKQLEEDLVNGKLTLFSGTACQIQGIQKYLETRNVPSQNLYTCDLICHGVPSPKIYREYIHFFEEKYHTKIKKFNFRDKSYGWQGHVETMKLQDGRKITTSHYRDIFYSNNCLRPSCYSCQFAKQQRVADFTVGDFWGIERTNKSFFDQEGVSLIFVQTEKAKEIFRKILQEDYLLYFSTKLENCLQHNLQSPTEKPKTREIFWQEYHKRGFKFIIKKYGNYGIKKKINTKINFFLKHKILRKY